MSVLFTHPTGNQNVRRAVEGLEDLGLVEGFATSVATFQGNLWDRLGSTQPGAEFRRRSFDERLKAKTLQHPWRELGRMASSRLGFDRLTEHERGAFCVDRVYRSLDRLVAKKLSNGRGDFASVNAVYCYEDGALETFRVAEKLGLLRFYDLPIGYWRAAQQLMTTESERWPQWIPTMPGFRDSSEKLTRKDEELSLADHIYVASSFTRSTLEHFPGELSTVEVIPYGFPPVSAPREYSALGGRKLRLLFVGGLSQRKGIADVFAVADQLADELELTIVGDGPVDECPELAGALRRHRWIRTMPHDRILQTMREHDLLLFPSLFEGFGLVITEAMSQGTPVITTDRTAGGDLIEHGVNGWLVPAGCTDSLRRQVEQLLNNRDCIASCGEMARQSAQKRPWSQYGRELADSVRQVLSDRNSI